MACIPPQEYSLDQIPHSPTNTAIYLDIGIHGRGHLGRLTIELFRNSFPAGVENLIRIASGETSRTFERGAGEDTYYVQHVRSFSGTTIHSQAHDQYIMAGNLVANKPSTIYSSTDGELAIPENYVERWMDLSSKGTVVLVPFLEDGKRYYDSTFAITLGEPRANNDIQELLDSGVVVGRVVSGISVLDEINRLITPNGVRSRTIITILESGVLSRDKKLFGANLLGTNMPRAPPRSNRLVIN